MGEYEEFVRRRNKKARHLLMWVLGCTGVLALGKMSGISGLGWWLVLLPLWGPVAALAVIVALAAISLAVLGLLWGFCALLALPFD